MKKIYLILITAIFLTGCKDSNSESVNTSEDTTVQESTVAKSEIEDGKYASENFADIDITIASDVWRIGKSAYFDTGAASLTIEEGSILEVIDANAFVNTRIEELVLPETVQYIGCGAFRDNCMLKKVRIESMNAMIAMNAFIRIGDNTVFECYRGSTAEAYVLNNSFCKEQGITIDYIDEDSDVKPIDTDNWETYAYVVDGELMFCSWIPEGELVIPDEITSIAEDAFLEYTFDSLTIPESVTSIGECAFYDTSINSVTIEGSGLETIGDCAFRMTDITEITIPSSVKSIGTEAFVITQLEKVRIESMDVVIDDYAFVSSIDENNHEMTIQCYKGSTAEKYAIKNADKGITISYIED